MKRVFYLLMIFAALSCSTSSTPEPDNSGGSTGGGQGTGGDGNGGGQGGGSGNGDPSFTLPDIAVFGDDESSPFQVLVTWEPDYTQRELRNAEDYFGERVSLTTTFGSISNFRAAGTRPTNVYQYNATADSFQKFEASNFFQPVVTDFIVEEQMQADGYFTQYYVELGSPGNRYLNVFDLQTSSIENYFVGELIPTQSIIKTTNDLAQIYLMDANTSAVSLYLVWLSEGLQYEVPFDAYCCSLYNPFDQQVYLFRDSASPSYDVFDLSSGMMAGTGSMSSDFRPYDIIMEGVFRDNKMFFRIPEISTFGTLPAIYDFGTDTLTTFDSIGLSNELIPQIQQFISGIGSLGFVRVDYDDENEILMVSINYSTATAQNEHAVLFVDLEGTVLDFVNTSSIRPWGILIE